jgi:ATP-dependent DNA ligase
MSSALTEFMAENYAKAVSIDLAEWLELNPPSSLCEPKQDGFRVFLFKSHEKILLTTRHGVIYSESTHPRLFKRIEVLNVTGVPDQLVLDGEYISPDELHIFDVLRIGEEDLTGQILTKRKKTLSELLSGQREFLEVSSELKNSFQEIMEYKERQLLLGKEGIIVKNPLSTYGQKNSWLKLKRHDTADCFITGVERTLEMDRTGIPHSWFVGLYDESGDIVEMGKVGTYLKEVDPSRIDVGTVVELQYQEITEDNKFRGPFIIKIREDKTMKECTTSQVSFHRK